MIIESQYDRLSQHTTEQVQLPKIGNQHLFKQKSEVLFKEIESTSSQFSTESIESLEQKFPITNINLQFNRINKKIKPNIPSPYKINGSTGSVNWTRQENQASLEKLQYQKSLAKNNLLGFNCVNSIEEESHSANFKSQRPQFFHQQGVFGKITMGERDQGCDLYYDLTSFDSLKRKQGMKLYYSPFNKSSYQIFVRTLTGKNLALEVNGEEQIESIQNRIFEQEGIPVQHQRLTFGAKDLMDKHNLQYYSINQDSTISLMLRLLSGFTIFLKNVDSNEQTKFEVSPNIPIAELKRMVSKALQFDTNSFELMFSQSILEDGKCLSDYRNQFQNGYILIEVICHDKQIMYH